MGGGHPEGEKNIIDCGRRQGGEVSGLRQCSFVAGWLADLTALRYFRTHCPQDGLTMHAASENTRLAETVMIRMHRITCWDNQ